MNDDSRNRPSGRLQFEDEAQDDLTSGIGAPAKSTDFVGRGGATECADFGRKTPEGAERSLQRRGPKLGGKLRQESKEARPTERLKHEDKEATPHDSPGPSNKKEVRDGKRFEKSGQRVEKTGAKLDDAKEKLDTQKPPKKPGPVTTIGRAAKFEAWRYAHGKINQVEHENVGIEAAHKTELTGETVVRGGTRFIKGRIRARPTRQVRKWERKNMSAKADYAFRQMAQEHPELKKNTLSRFYQKQRIKKQYRQQAKQAAKATQKTAVTTEKIAGAAWGFVKRNPKVFILVLCLLLIIVILQSCMAAAISIGNGLTGAIAASTYSSEDVDMLGAEAAYLALEAELQEYLDSYEATHSYDEYHYDLDDIEHDPYVLISMLSAFHEGAWTVDEVQNTLAMLFERQYILSETVVTERRYYIETDTWTDENGDTHTDSYRVYYDYYICTVTLENFNLSHLPIHIMGEEQLSRYALYMGTLGNRPDLFPSSSYIGKYITNGPTLHDVPEEYLNNETFAAILAEAEKYIGYPYVWGGYSPTTSFDCSGFVSYVYNQCGWDFGRLGAQGLCNISTRTSNPQPGDLVFFTGTYDTPGVSHVGIYVGDGWMLHCGDPIQYADLSSSYWQSHFYCYGRMP